MPLALGVLLVGAAVLAFAVVAEKAAGTAAGTAGAAGAPGSAGTPSTPAAGTASQAQIRDYLTANGLTKVAAAGVVGNLQQESSLNPATPGGGLAQWIGSRWTALQAFASGHGLDPSSADAQLEYLVQDLRGPYSSLLTQLNAASTPGEAATLFSSQYERPGTPMLQNRIDYANQAYAA